MFINGPSHALRVLLRDRRLFGAHQQLLPGRLQQNRELLRFPLIGTRASHPVGPLLGLRACHRRSHGCRQQERPARSNDHQRLGAACLKKLLTGLGPRSQDRRPHLRARQLHLLQRPLCAHPPRVRSRLRGNHRRRSRH